MNYCLKKVALIKYFDRNFKISNGFIKENFRKNRILIIFPKYREIFNNNNCKRL